MLPTQTCTKARFTAKRPGRGHPDVSRARRPARRDLRAAGASAFHQLPRPERREGHGGRAEARRLRLLPRGQRGIGGGRALAEAVEHERRGRCVRTPCRHFAAGAVDGELLRDGGERRQVRRQVQANRQRVHDHEHGLHSRLLPRGARPGRHLRDQARGPAHDGHRAAQEGRPPGARNGGSRHDRKELGLVRSLLCRPGALGERRVVREVRRRRHEPLHRLDIRRRIGRALFPAAYGRALAAWRRNYKPGARKFDCLRGACGVSFGSPQNR